MATTSNAQRYVLISAVGSIGVIVIASASRGKFPSAKQGMAAGLVYVAIAAISDADPRMAGPLSGIAFTSIALAEGLQFAKGVENVNKYQGTLPTQPTPPGGAAGASTPGS